MKYKSKPIFTISLTFLFLICIVILKQILSNEPKEFMKNYNQKTKRIINSQIIDIQSIINLLPCSNTDRNMNKANEPCEYMQKIKNCLGIFDYYGHSDHLTISKSELHLARLYINTIKLSISNAFYIDFPGLIDGSAWPPSGQGNQIFIRFLILNFR
jgi:hypothetical protein